MVPIPASKIPTSVSYTTLDSPIGALHVAATDRGLVRVAFATSSVDDIRTELVATMGCIALVADRRLDLPTQQITEFLNHRRTEFDLDLDLRLARGFRREVLTRMRTIPYGHTQSYRQLATDTDRPGAARAVGSACSRNPIVLVIPCHRVIRTDGSVGEYAGGIATKESLLRMEAR